ncbi:MAG TPA: hypothetical protein VMT62_06985 [Syntrophorhabdaceae bacterium]|nr:hypothetical protein [Syntrophorhabdaceae bacterium]
MGEIKSAIELAMERTRNIVIDEEERQDLMKKDMDNKVRAALRRYMEGMTDPQSAQRELGGIKGDEKARDAILAGLLIERFGLSRETNQRLFLLLHLVTDPSRYKELEGELKALEDDFADEANRRRVVVARDIGDRLKQMGVTGSAVEPNVETWDEWKQGLHQVEMSFSARLLTWKQRADHILNP